jgi:hypothetical protein
MFSFNEFAGERGGMNAAYADLLVRPVAEPTSRFCAFI